MKLLRSFVILSLAACALVLTGCSTALSVHKAVDLSSYRRIYVESRLSDNHRLDAKIADALNALGLEATYGVPTMRPEKGIDAIISYEDRWQWDFKDYMIQIKIDVRDVRKNQPLATGSYYQASVKTKSAEEVVRLIVTPLFKKT